MSGSVFHRLPAPVRPLLARWLGEMLGLLGADVEGVLLFGSLALDDFAPAWSDVDVAVALCRPPDEDDARRMAGLHADLRRAYLDDGRGAWTSEQLVEGFLVASTQFHMPDGGGPGCELSTGGARYLEDGRLEPFDRLVLARHGLRLMGGPVVVVPPTEDALRQQHRRDLDSLELKRDPSPVWQVGMLHWGARALRYWRDGVLTSKREALEHEIRRSGALAEAFLFALDARERGARDCRSRPAEVAAVFDGVREPLIQALSAYA